MSFPQSKGTLPPRSGLPPRGRAGGYAERQCARVVAGTVGGVDERICGKPPAIHIIWEDDGQRVETGWACAEHGREVAERWKPVATHAVGGCCGMPGAIYDVDLNECRYDGDLPTAEPVRAVAVEVPA